MAESLSETLLVQRPTYGEIKLKTSIKNSKSSENHKCLDGELTMNPKLKFDEAHQIVKDKFKLFANDIVKILKTFDLEKTNIVTKGELRRVLDKYCLPLTTTQYDTLLENIPMVISKNGSVNYQIFINHFSDKPFETIDKDVNMNNNLKLPALQRSATTLATINNMPSNNRNQLSSSHSNRSSVSSSFSNTHRNWSYSMFTIDDLIPVIQKKVSQNPTAFLKALRLFDFNSDQTIQKYRFKKILENFCCAINENQFEKLVTKFSHTESGSINYIEFLRNLGIPVTAKGNLDNQKKKLPQFVPTTLDNSLDVALTEVGLVSPLDLEKLAHTFRNRVESKFEILKRTFYVLDPNVEGYVNLEQLHKVLSNFIFPMSQNVFHQLMEKFAFKATGRIPWLTFLKKFLDPQSNKLNGITFPTKSDLICNPIQGVNNETSMEELLALLYQHVNNNYGSFRDAFLRINKFKNGKISKAEFLKILKRFQFNISSEQAKMLFNFLDPNKRGFITYHHFLQLFEQKEHLSAHPWLNSNHKVIDVKTDLPITGDLMKQNLRQHCIEKWPQLVGLLRNKDPKSTGYISIKNLKKVLLELFDYLHDEDIERLITNLKSNDKNTVSYLELLNLLDIDPRPSDSTGVSAQITATNELDNKERIAEHKEKMNGITRNVAKRLADTSIDEVIVRIRDKLKQERASSFELYRKYECKDSKGGINKNQLKQLIESIGFVLSDEQMNEVCNKIDFPQSSKKRVDFNQFLICFLDDRSSSNDLAQSECFLPPSNHHVNDIRGQNSRILNTNTLEIWLRKHIAFGYSSLMAAHKKLDVKARGYISRSDLQHILDLHNITVDSEIFNEVCNKLGISINSKLNYTDFLNVFQLRDDLEEGHKWLNSQHKFNDLNNNNIIELSCEEVAKLLPQKIQQYYHQCAPSFCHIITGGKGYMTFANFKDLLMKLQLDMDKKEMRKLWKLYDLKGHNQLDYQGFLDNMGLTNAWGGIDNQGISSQIISGSHNAIVEHLANQELLHQQTQDRQAVLGSHINVEHVYEAIKRHLRTCYQDNSTAFKAICSGKTLTSNFTLDNLDKLLTQMHMFVANDKFIQLAARLGFQGPDDSLDYTRFCNVFRDKILGKSDDKPDGRGKIDNEQSRHSSGYHSSKEGGTEVRTIHVEEAVSSMKSMQILKVIEQKIQKQIQDITQTFQVVDTDSSGLITGVQFRNLLSSFCMAMSDEQYAELLKNELTMYCAGAPLIQLNTSSIINELNNITFDYRAYLNRFNDKEVTNELNSNKAVKVPQEMSTNQIAEFVNESIKARPKLFLDNLRQRDYALIGVVSKSDLQAVLEQLVFKLTSAQFDRYWNEHITTNNFQNVDYVDLIRRISGYDESLKESQSRPVTAMSHASTVSTRRPSEYAPDEDDDSSEITRRCLEKVLHKHWQIIFSKCRPYSTKTQFSQVDSSPAHATINIDDFSKILMEYDSSLTSDAIRTLNLYKTVMKSSDSIRYGDLIRSVVLSSRGSMVSHESAHEVQTKFENAGIKLCSMDGSKNYFPFLFKLRRQILQNWKELRHQFLSRDKNQIGMVSGTVVMTIVTKTCGRLNPDLFYHLMTLYDTDGSGKFNYKRFIEDFLKTA